LSRLSTMKARMASPVSCDSNARICAPSTQVAATATDFSDIR
jgi:hypothetical protein